MSDTIAIDLDIAGDLDTSLAHMLHEVTKDHASITYRIVDEVGPSAWPVVRFVGDPIDIFAFVLEYAGGDHEQAYELLMG